MRHLPWRPRASTPSAGQGEGGCLAAKKSGVVTGDGTRKIWALYMDFF